MERVEYGTDGYPYKLSMSTRIENTEQYPTVEAIPKDEYEARLKADLVAMLTEIQLEIEEIKMGNNVPFGFEPVNKFYEGVSASSKVVQQKIEQLKENNE